jgi:hypothetical protein
MSIDPNTEAKPAGPNDQDDVSLKETVHYEAVENQGARGLVDEDEDPKVTLKTWVVVWVSTSLRW